MAIQEQDMIVDPPFTDNITRLKLPSKSTFISNVRESEYRTGESYGFDIVSEDEDSLSAYLVSSSPIRIQSYDTNRGALVTEDVVDTTVIPFRVDFERGFLEVFSNKQDNGEVINRLGQTVADLTSSESRFKIVEVREYLSRNNVSANIDAIRINNFSPRENTSGNCYLNTFDNTTAYNLIKEYQDDISYISIKVTYEEENVTIGLYRSGTIRIFSETNNGPILIEHMKNYLCEEGMDA